MPDEYKLKYPGEKIDTLLEKIDGVGIGSKETAGLLKLTDDLNDSQDGLAVTPQAVKSAVEGMAGKIKDQFKTVTATFTVDGWTAENGKYTQSKTVTNSETFTIKNVLPPLTTQTGNANTDATKRRNLGTIASGTTEFTVTASNITVKITADIKPDCDLDVTWYLEV
nr:MAG TPA: hypothetical protein [Bacteriophage sp.]